MEIVTFLLGGQRRLHKQEETNEPTNDRGRKTLHVYRHSAGMVVTVLLQYEVPLPRDHALPDYALITSSVGLACKTKSGFSGTAEACKTKFRFSGT